MASLKYKGMVKDPRFMSIYAYEAEPAVSIIVYRDVWRGIKVRVDFIEIIRTNIKFRHLVDLRYRPW